MVGFNREKYGAVRFEFPKGNPSQRSTVREIISALPPPTILRTWDASEDVPHHPNHWCLKPKSKKFFDGFLKGGVKGRPFRVLEWGKPSWTVAYGHREVHIHPSGKRRLSFSGRCSCKVSDPDYVLKGNLSDQIRLVSDAVPPPLARALAQSVLDVLCAAKGKEKQARMLAAS